MKRRISTILSSGTIILVLSMLLSTVPLLHTPVVWANPCHPEVSGDCEGACVTTVSDGNYLLQVKVDGTEIYNDEVGHGFSKCWSMEELEIDPCATHTIWAKYRYNTDSTDFGGPQCCGSIQRCIKALKFEDKNGDGHQGYGEDGLSGWVFTLYRKENGDWVEKGTQTTDSNGYADFGEWPVGDEYKILETRQDGWTCTNCTTAEASFTLSECGCGCKVVKFGNRQPPQRCIKARKFNDKNGNGEWEWWSDEEGLNDWVFTLKRKDEHGEWVAIATATTAGSGWQVATAYFGEWPVGDEYKIVETRQDGWACTNCDTAEEPFTLESSRCGCKEVKFGNLQSPACAPGDMEGAATLVRTGNTVYWVIKNNSSHSLIIESIELSWPTATGNLTEVRLDGATIYNQVTTPTHTKIESGWAGTLADRTIGAGPDTTETLEFEFESQAGDPPETEPYWIGVQCFGQGCYDEVGEEGGPTVITLSSFAAKSSAGGSASPLWLGLAGVTVLAAGSLFWAKRRAG